MHYIDISFYPTIPPQTKNNRVQVLNIPVLLLACSQDWTCNLQMIFSLEA